MRGILDPITITSIQGNEFEKTGGSHILEKHCNGQMLCRSADDTHME